MVAKPYMFHNWDLLYLIFITCQPVQELYLRTLVPKIEVDQDDMDLQRYISYSVCYNINEVHRHVQY